MPVTGRQVALIRGINVGKAKRIAMADLRELVAGLGYRDVRTLLNSGNVVFSTPATPAKAAACLQEAIAAQLGVTARVIVLPAADVGRIINQNPLLDVADNPSRLLVAVLATPRDRRRLTPLLEQSWSPDALALGPGVAYLWCQQGILASPLSAALNRALGENATARNWATMTKIHALLQEPSR